MNSLLITSIVIFSLLILGFLSFYPISKVQRNHLINDSLIGEDKSNIISLLGQPFHSENDSSFEFIYDQEISYPSFFSLILKLEGQTTGGTLALIQMENGKVVSIEYSSAGFGISK